MKNSDKIAFEQLDSSRKLSKVIAKLRAKVCDLCKTKKMASRPDDFLVSSAS